MKEGSHVYTSQQALAILREVAGKPDLFAAPESRTAKWLPSSMTDSLTATGAGYDLLAYETGNCDHQNDVELVDVDGPLEDRSRDDPHLSEGGLTDNDEPHYESDDSNFTAYNHFIDVRKGPGIYDDFDGYSYGRGSASKDQYEKAASWSDISIDEGWGMFKTLAKAAADRWADEALAWWFNDEYVHAPGDPWYRPGLCSRALERYTHVALWGPGGALATNEDECKARFPLGYHRTRGGIDEGIGYPASVFAPVDNLALANWRDFTASGDQASLGRVLHGIQDASVPHHAAGTCGNFHRKYERAVQEHIIAWETDPAVRDEVKNFLNMWDRADGDAPTSIKVGDERLIPAENWEIDQLLTWVALHAYDAYANVYRGFEGGFAFDENSARGLVVLSLAMSAHVLRRAARQQGLIPPRVQVPVKPVDTGAIQVDTVGVSDGSGGGQGEPMIIVPGFVVAPHGGPEVIRDHRGHGTPPAHGTPRGDSKVDPITPTPKPVVRDHRHG